MFYYLSQFKDLYSALNIFKYITFRAGMAAVTTFLLCIMFGPFIIEWLKKLRVQEVVQRQDAPGLDQFQTLKHGTPTMGGIFVVGSILLSSLFWCDLTNPYVQLTLLVCFCLAVLGFTDDYIKLTRPKQRGLNKRTKFFWQGLIAFFVGYCLYFHLGSSTWIDVPFAKDVALNFGVFYIGLVVVIIVGASNAVNLTDGLDGLAIGCVLIVAIAFAALSYVTGHIKFSEYLLIPYVMEAGELTIICAAIIGASLGFLWFNCFPATIFMGDVGSLSLGGTLGVIAVLIKKEILLVLVGGVFVFEAISVILQVFSFRLLGKRIFKMSPFHHHLQLLGWKESKIITRFWIAGIILALLTLTTLKIR